MARSPSVATTAGQEELRRRGVRPIPSPDEVTSPYWEAARNHRLVVPKCASCARWQWPPTGRCDHCGSTRRDWTELSGRGRVFSYIVDHRNMVPGFEGAYVVALVVPVEVEDDSVRIATNLPGTDPEDVRIDMPVLVDFQEVAPDVVLPQFRAER